MKKWLKRTRAAMLMGVTWALAWGFIGGGVMEGIVDPHGQILDMWPQALAIPGFFGGAFFSAVLGIAEGRRGFSELSLPRFTALGAGAGLLLSLLGLSVLGGLGLTLAAAIVTGSMTLMSAGSAAGSLALARMADQGASLDSGADMADVGLTEDEVRELLGGRA